ncbi:MAG: DUF3467 domain-containing protein [Phycisphaerales bacterium]|nr:DUF3467 domain-containing protein [Phycisphaerales bacterium]
MNQNSNNNNELPPGELQIEITDDLAEGKYINLAIITHSHAEFIFDFINAMPNMSKAKVKSRFIFSPVHAKQFANVLMSNIQKYESLYGKIKDAPHNVSANIMPPSAQA